MFQPIPRVYMVTIWSTCDHIVTFHVHYKYGWDEVQFIYTPSSQPQVDIEAYLFAAGLFSKSQYHRLWSSLTASCHHPRQISS